MQRGKDEKTGSFMCKETLKYTIRHEKGVLYFLLGPVLYVQRDVWKAM